MFDIAFDIDGVLTDFQKFQLEKGREFFKSEPVDLTGYTISEIFGCTDSEEELFWKKYLLPYSIKYKARPYASMLTNWLHEKGARVHIITSRVFTDENSKKGKLMRYIVEEWLKHNNIYYDNIEFCNDSKIDAVKRWNIDLMVEDSKKNIKELSKYTNIICVDAFYNRGVSGPNITRVKGLDEIAEITYDKLDNYKKKMNNEIKPISSYGSIDKPWRKYYTYGQAKNKNSDISIYDYMYHRNKRYTNQVALEYFGKRITYSEFFDKINQCADSFLKMGVRVNDIVTICMPNTPEAVIAFYALNKIGAVSNMIHPLKSENEIRDYLNEVNSKFMVCIDMNYDKINNIIDQTNLSKVIVSSCKDSMPFNTKFLYGLSLKKSNNFYKDSVDSSKYISWDNFMKNGDVSRKINSPKYESDRIAVLMHTGGTTGTPKAVKLTNKNFNSMVNQFHVIANNFQREDKMLTVMPVFHGFGLCSSIHLPLSFGVSSILVPQLDSKSLRKIMKNDKPNHIIGVPTLWRKIVDDKVIDKMDLSHIKYCVSGGDALKNEDEVNEFLKNHGSSALINKGYGLSVTFSYNGCNRSGSIGIPMVDTNIKIVDIGTTNEVPYNNVGEICVSGDTVMQGYYNNLDATLNSLKKHSDGKIWLHTGDIGRMTNEGILYYVDREKRMFVSSGVNVYPCEIEKVLTSIQGVKQCAVVSMPHPYKMAVAKAYLVLEDGVSLDDNLRLKIDDACKKNLDKYHWPKAFEEIDSLPQTAIGKINYRQLEELSDSKVMVKNRGF